MNITIIQSQTKTRIEGKVGEPLTAALLRAGVSISSPCGGRGTCGKCKVKLTHSGKTEEVLACQTILRDEEYEVAIEDATHSQTAFSVSNAELPQKPQTGYGLAVDIGTTTIEALVADLETGAIVGYDSVLNPQKIYGADVISRIAACSQSGAIQQMQQLVMDAIQGISQKLLSLVHSTKAERMVVVGNTTMLHLFCGVDPAPLGQVPFTPVFDETIHIDPQKEQAYQSLRAKEIILLPSVSAYIGADIVADVVELKPQNMAQNVLLADLGTNGEMVLKKGTEFYCTSTAAGPALEGANIECGIGGVEGAISEILSWEPLKYKTIGNKTPIGICGSGLVDLVARLLEKECIDESGALEHDKIEITENVYLSKKDVRQMQLAKSAIRTGLEMLLESAKMDVQQIDIFYILGGLGTHINTMSAQRAGFFPKQLHNKIQEGGNGSLKGAYRILINPERVQEAEQFKTKAKVIELGNNPEFNDRFVDNLFFE